MLKKVSTTIQLPKNVMDSLNKYKAESGVSKNIIIERCLKALFEGRIIDLPSDLMAHLKRAEEDFGSSHSFVIEKALQMLFAEDIEAILKEKK